MKTVIVYESMFGNTRVIAEAIASGLRPENEVVVVPVGGARPEALDGAGLVVVGGPTHVHGMSRGSTRKGASDMAHKPAARFSLDPGAEGPGLREWFADMGRVNAPAAAFDTRLKGPALFTGRASKGIARQLRQHGLTMAARPESFLVTSDNQLATGEQDRAQNWGRQLASKITAMKVGAAD